MDKAMGFLICAGIVVAAQILALRAYESWWDSETGGSAAMPESTVQFITLGVSLGVSSVILKLWPDDHE